MSPEAHAAATARTGTSSSPVISDASTSVPCSGPKRATTSAVAARSPGPVVGTSLDDRPHAGEHVEIAPAPAPDVDAFHGDLAARHDARGHDPEGGLGRVAGDVELEGRQLRRAEAHRRGRRRPRSSSVMSCPAPGQHLLGVAAGEHRLAHDGVAPGAQAGEKHARLDLGAGHRRRVVDAVQGAAADRERGQAALGAAVDRGPHPTERHGHAVHGPLRQRRVPGELRGPGPARHDAGQKAHGGARVAQVEGSARFVQDVEASGDHGGARGGVGLDMRARGPAMAAAVRATSSPSERPRTVDSPRASAPRRRARCDTDLSPGTGSAPQRVAALHGEHRVVAGGACHVRRGTHPRCRDVER